MVNISPIGRNASVQERLDFQKYDAQHQIRARFVTALKEEFPDFGLTYVWWLAFIISFSLSLKLNHFFTLIFTHASLPRILAKFSHSHPSPPFCIHLTPSFLPRQ